MEHLVEFIEYIIFVPDRIIFLKITNAFST